MRKARIEISLEDCEVLFKGLYRLKNDSVSWQEWDARSDLLDRLTQAENRILRHSTSYD